MKATEITQPGFYWYFLDDGVSDAELVDVAISGPQMGYQVWTVGDDRQQDLLDFAGDFVGPIDPPARPV